MRSRPTEEHVFSKTLYGDMDKHDLLRHIVHARVIDKRSAILDACRGMSVLDVGCVGQDLTVSAAEWLHGQLMQVARHVTGVDTNADGVASGKSAGYDICTPHELQQRGKTFDVVLMADVIEHVDNLQIFIMSYLRYLAPRGRMLITTPNPFYFLQWLCVTAKGRPYVNPEHTMWLDPMTLMEVCRRSRLPIAGFAWLREYGPAPSGPIGMFLRFAARSARTCRRYFSPGFLLVLTCRECDCDKTAQ